MFIRLHCATPDPFRVRVGRLNYYLISVVFLFLVIHFIGKSPKKKKNVLLQIKVNVKKGSMARIHLDV